MVSTLLKAEENLNDDAATTVCNVGASSVKKERQQAFSLKPNKVGGNLKPLGRACVHTVCVGINFQLMIKSTTGEPLKTKSQ